MVVQHDAKAEFERERERHIINELGLAIHREGDELHGAAPVVAEMFAPQTGCVRASIFATWTDVLAGLLVGHLLEPRVPVTLELAVDLHRPAHGLDSVHAAGRLVKAGRSVFFASVDFTAVDGTPIAMGTASFMPAPDTTLRLPSMVKSLATNHGGGGRLSAPFAERANCTRRAPGVAVLARSDDGLNSSNTINGGLIALAVEEATLSDAPGATVGSLAMRYLRPARVGPIVATSARHADLARVEVRDSGSDDRLVVVATTRLFAPRR